MTLANMKFKVSGPEQSERLQKVLFTLGYKWTTGWVQYTEKPHLYAYDNGLLMQSNCDHHFESKVFPEQDTELFIAAHENKADKMVTMCFRDSDEGKVAFKGLETAWDEPLVTESPWFDNDGTKPDVGGASVDIMFRDGEVSENNPVSAWDWNFHTGESVAEIIKWRFHKPEDANYYVQPDTEVTGTWKLANGSSIEFEDHAEKVTGMFDEISFQWHSDVMSDNVEETPASIDAHYSFTYHLTQDDVDMGFIKIDPYFVSQQWQLGSKDSTGVIFHLLKTIARFGDKNSKDREINALYKSTIRLAQLEGVELK